MRRRWVRRLLFAGLGTVALMAIWLLVVRVSAPSRALRVVEQDDVPAASPDVPRDPSLLRVACYNIAHGRGTGEENWNGESAETREKRLTEIAAFLSAADLDVVVLNEVDFNCSWSHGRNQAEHLAIQAGFRYRLEQRNFDLVLPFRRWQCGNAVLSRYPIVQARLLDLPGDSRWESGFAGKKTAALCTIQLPDGSPLDLVPVHLSDRSEAVRAESCEAIRTAASLSKSPCLLMGDFNSMPSRFPGSEAAENSALDRLLRDGRWSTLPREQPLEPDLTYSTRHPDRVIDWILAPKPWSLISKQVFPLMLSDHRPVVGVLRRDATN